MRIPSLLLVSACTLFATRAVSAQVPVTFGPMVHYHWGKESHGFAYGGEISFWFPSGVQHPGLEHVDLMTGFDIGFDFQEGRKRWYSEVQLGYFAGGSLGPYFEWGSGRPPGYGLQGSVWGALSIGIDLRVRYGTEGFTAGPGTMGKLFWCLDDCDSDEEEDYSMVPGGRSRIP